MMNKHYMHSHDHMLAEVEAAPSDDLLVHLTSAIVVLDFIKVFK